jgi:hypothetical protein
MRGAYRVAVSAYRPPMSVTYVAVSSWQALRVAGVALLGVLAVVAHGATAFEIVELVGAVVLLALLVFPLVTVRAAVEGNEVVLRGQRWPGPTMVWSCALDEADVFETELVDAKVPRLTLRTKNGRRLPLTERAYPGSRWMYPKLVARLDNWLDASRSYHSRQLAVNCDASA